MSPISKTPPLPWRQSPWQVLQTFRYRYLCLFLLSSFSHLNCPLRYFHSAFLLKQDPRLRIACAFIDLLWEFSFRLAFTFNEPLASLGISSPSSLSMGSMCKPLCSQQIHGQRKACRTGNSNNWQPSICPALISRESGSWEEHVRTGLAVRWTGQQDVVRFSSVLYISPLLHPMTPLRTPPHAHSYMHRLRNASTNIGKKNNWLRLFNIKYHFCY